MEKIWLKNYPPGVPAEINPALFESLVDVFENSCKQYKNCPAFYNLGVTLTFQEIDFYSKCFAAFLQQELKLKQGDRVAIMLPNILQYPVAMFGILRAGLVVVNVNPLYTVPELVHQLKDAQVETIIVLSMFAHTVESALSQTQLKNVIVTELCDFLPRWKGFLIDFTLKYITRKIPAWSMPAAIHFRDAMARAKKLTLQPVLIKHSDIALLQYTGGTTGVAKGAMLTHRNLVANILQVQAWCSPLLENGKEIIITALPLYHVFSMLANCLFISSIGGLNVLITNPRRLPSMISEMKKFKFSIITGVNTLFNALLKNPEFKQCDFSSLKMSLGGGMAVQQVVADQWEAITGSLLLEAYGLTETSPAVAINPVDMKEHDRTVGLPIPSTDVCLIEGELAVKGPQVMLGYWNNPEETKKVFNEAGWLLTGDIATIDANGFIRICDRKKDMIIVSGFKIYPNDIEAVLSKMKGVHEVGVVGVPDENSGEVVKAVIVRDDPNLTVEDVLSYCHENFTGYKIPKYVEFRDDLPKSNVGKILRRALR